MSATSFTAKHRNDPLQGQWITQAVCTLTVQSPPTARCCSNWTTTRRMAGNHRLGEVQGQARHHTMYSYVNDTHEVRRRELVREEVGDGPLSISTEVSPIVHEYALLRRPKANVRAMVNGASSDPNRLTLAMTVSPPSIPTRDQTRTTARRGRYVRRAVSPAAQVSSKGTTPHAGPRRVRAQLHPSGDHM